MHLLTIMLLMATLQGNAASQSRPAVVAGTVVKQGSSEAISKATVTLSGEDDVSRSYTAVTSTDGKFSFDNVVAGRYRLSSTRDGYARAEYGDRGANGCGAILALTEGQRLTDAQVVMIPAGVIAGRLRDQDGEPAANVTVSALKYTCENGKRVLAVMETARTNDLGEYRLFWLPPGRYYVGAALQVSVSPTRISLDNADIAVSKGIELPGRVSAGDPQVLARIMSVTLRPMNGSPG